MANLTIAIDDQLLQAARIKALQQGTSVNEICREAIAKFAGVPDDAEDFMAKWRALAASIPPSSDGRPLWPGREALYEEALAQRTRGTAVDAPPARIKPGKRR